MTFQSTIRPGYARRRCEAGDRLIDQHVPLVRKLAWHVHSRLSAAAEIEDLIQIGLVALIEAVRSYEDRGYMFSTYASVRIRGAMVDHLRKLSGDVRSAPATRRAIEAARRTALERLGSAATDADVANILGVAPAAYAQMQRVSGTVQEVPLDLDQAEQDLAFRDPSPLADEIIDQCRSDANLRIGIASLPEREQLVLQLYFSEELNLDEIGAVLGVGAARVCQIKKAALARLRTKLSTSSEERSHAIRERGAASA